MRRQAGPPTSTAEGDGRRVQPGSRAASAARGARGGALWGTQVSRRASTSCRRQGGMAAETRRRRIVVAVGTSAGQRQAPTPSWFGVVHELAWMGIAVGVSGTQPGIIPRQPIPGPRRAAGRQCRGAGRRSQASEGENLSWRRIALWTGGRAEWRCMTVPDSVWAAPRREFVFSDCLRNAGTKAHVSAEDGVVPVVSSARARWTRPLCSVGRTAACSAVAKALQDPSLDGIRRRVGRGAFLLERSNAIHAGGGPVQPRRVRLKGLRRACGKWPGCL